MKPMSELFAKAKVVFTALPTYLALATLALTVVADELVPLLPPDMGLRIAGYIATALAILAAVIRTISRLTAADPATYGLLPPPTGDPVSVPEFP